VVVRSFTASKSNNAKAIPRDEPLAPSISEPSPQLKASRGSSISFLTHHLNLELQPERKCSSTLVKLSNTFMVIAICLFKFIANSFQLFSDRLVEDESQVEKEASSSPQA
jgi:hypothetical protein